MTAPVLTPAAPVTAPGLDFLDARHRIYLLHREAWEREERRLTGGDAVLEELTQFAGESDISFAARRKKASYVNFPKAHAAIVTGQLRLHAPSPDKGLDFGQLGKIRSRDMVKNDETLAELLYYNTDGIGNDGSEFPAWYDAVDERAQATGHRWILMETPQRDNPAAPTQAEVRAGFRPYAVEYSPLEVTNWYFRAGQLQFAVIRVLLDEPILESGVFQNQVSTPDAILGYYLLVRQGYTGLGARFQEGGWWLFDRTKQEKGHKLWTNTLGQIPLWIHYGEKSLGTYRRPALSRSSTMELGQIAVSLMDTISARDYDYWEACASALYFLGATPDTMQAVKDQLDKRSKLIGVPMVTGAVAGQDQRVLIYDGSLGAVQSAVSDLIVKAKYDEAREQSFQQVTSAPDSSGLSKIAGHNEQKAPYLARRAALRQGSENTFIYFAELRAGFQQPTGFSIYQRDFDLTPVVNDIDAMFDTLRRSGLRSPTLEGHMAFTAASERGLLPQGEEETVKAELGDSSAQKAQLAAQAASALAGIQPPNGTTPAATPSGTQSGTPPADAGVTPATQAGDISRIPSRLQAAKANQAGA